MLVLAINKGKYVSVNNGESLVQNVGTSKKGLILKVFKKNEDKTYTLEDTYLSTPEYPFVLDKDLKITHIKGNGKQMKLGFEGNYSVERCPDKFKFPISRPRNLDDDFFNFDTEGY